LFLIILCLYFGLILTISGISLGRLNSDKVKDNK